MPIVRGCNFPDALLYDVRNHVWYAEVGDGLLRAGMTQIGVALAREVIVFTPKRAGSAFEQNKSFGTIESAKWVGSVRAAFEGAVIAVNEQAMKQTALINSDCYGEGWLLLVRPDAGGWQSGLVSGEAIAAAYEAWMESEAWPGCE